MYKLRELERGDLPILNKWRNDKELIDCLGAPFRFINMETDEKWFNSYMQNRNSAIRCSIISENDEFIGLISLTSIDSINKSAELHIMIGNKNYHGKGAGTFAVNSMLKHAFENLNLNKVELSVLENNNKAIALYEKCGFVYEGKRRQAVYKDNKYLDLYLYSILKEESLWKSKF